MDIVITFLKPSKFYITSKNQRPVTSTSGKVGGARLRRFMVMYTIEVQKKITLPAATYPAFASAGCSGGGYGNRCSREGVAFGREFGVFQHGATHDPWGKTAMQVNTKWNDLKKTYRKTKYNNRSTGRARKDFAYEDEMDEFMGEKASTNPQVLIDPHVPKADVGAKRTQL